MKETSFLLLQAQLRALFPDEGLNQLAIYEDQKAHFLIFLVVDCMYWKKTI